MALIATYLQLLSVELVDLLEALLDQGLLFLNQLDLHGLLNIQSCPQEVASAESVLEWQIILYVGLDFLRLLSFSVRFLGACLLFDLRKHGYTSIEKTLAIIDLVELHEKVVGVYYGLLHEVNLLRVPVALHVEFER